MSEKAFYISELVQKKLSGEITAQEDLDLNNWLGQNEENKKLFDELSNEHLVAAELEKFANYDPDKNKIKIEKALKGGKLVRMKAIRWAAAAVVLLVAGGLWLTLGRKQEPGTQKPELVQTQDIAPGHEGAILTLANGQQVVLDSTKGTIANQGGVTIINKEGNVSYAKPQTANPKLEVVYNTMSTPNGRQYSLVLADGSKVWLNAGSSIRFPSAFTGKERRVEITGEAYFEVTHDASKPFHVSVDGTDVQVLGTHFNINSYSDEGATRVTLLQGSVRVTNLKQESRNSKSETPNPKSEIVLKPGEQAQVNHSTTQQLSIKITHPDLDQVMAWKNGFFSFENADIKELMKQLTRWYDVEVIYKGQPKDRFAGKIDRNLTLSQLLKGLAGSINFRIEEGKKLIILP